MKRASGTKGIKTASGSGLRILMKVVGWAVAVPALLAAVVIGGAAPLYLLLPSAEPAANVAETTRVPAPAAPTPARLTTATDAPAAVATTGELEPEPVEAIDESATGTAGSDLTLDEAAAPEEIVETAASVVPTPRPASPRPYTPPLTTDERSETAATSTPPPRREAALAETLQRDAGPAVKPPLDGRRSTVRTAAKLRSSPKGAEIGVLREGTEIVVGRCERWCEVQADGKTGFVHVSLIGEARKRSAERSSRRSLDGRASASRDTGEPRQIGRAAPRREARSERRRYESRDDEEAFYDRYYRRGEEPVWLDDDRYLPSEEPGWYVEDDRRPVRGGRPAMLYDPYY